MVISGEVHVQPVLNRVFKFGTSKSDGILEEWLKEQLQEGSVTAK